MPRPDPEHLLDDLDPEQREAVLATTGPVAILAGAGTRQDAGDQPAHRLRDRDRRVVPADQVLVVTFTDKAAGEMVGAARGRSGCRA